MTQIEQATACISFRRIIAAKAIVLAVNKIYIEE